MLSIDGQGDGTGSTTVVDTNPDNVTTTDPVVDTNIPVDGNSSAIITGTSSGDVTEDVDLTSSGKLTATDADAGESGFQDATENGDYGNFAIDGNGNWTYTLTNSDHLTGLDTGEVVTETFTVQTIDGTTSEVVVNVNGRDEPVANTGGSTNAGSGGGTSSTAGDIEVSSTAELIKALSGNVSGYTIVLAPGEYDTINLNGYNFSSPVTITSANPDNPAHFESITVSNSSNMVFDNLDISSYNAASGSWGEYLVTINNSSDIVISDSVIGNDVDGAIYGGFIGAIVKNSQDITIENTEFHNLSGGAGFISSNGVNVIDSEFYDIRSDGITFSGVQDVIIDGNYFHDFYHLTGDHSDYVQFWATAGLQANEDILIKNNLMVQGDGYDTQGIFMTATSDLPLDNVVIENNVIYQSGYHGISISTANDVSVSGNTVISPVDSASGYEVWVSLSNVTNGVVEDNISNSFIYNNSSVSESGNVVAYGSTVPWNAGSNPTYSYDDIFVDNNLNIGSVDATDFTVENGYNAGADVSLLQDGGSTSSTSSATTVASSTTTTSNDNWNEGTVGNDHIEGTAAVDEIFGFDGNDELFGFGGNDYIIGGDGADTLTGGAGSDTFVYTEVGDSGIGAANRDVILDFDATNGDHLSFEGFAATGFDYSFNDSTDVLSVDLNGDFVIDMEIQLIGVSAVDLDNSDFLT
ncbi:MAG: VCBS domain-containing protein [Sneathiella sp.]|nr:VCBS domain-containing protein [Sneathiella sp.]